MKERERTPLMGCLIVAGSLGFAGYMGWEKVKLERAVHSEQVRNQDLGHGQGYREAICDVERVELFRRGPRNEPRSEVDERIIHTIQEIRENNC